MSDLIDTGINVKLYKQDEHKSLINLTVTINQQLH